MKKAVLVFLFLGTYIISYCQVIKGTIFDGKTKKPVYSAAVYFNGTSVGTLSDDHGNFQLDISKFPSMPLTISAIGYYSYTLSDISRNKSNLVYLNPRIFELNEVVIKEKSQWWKRNENLTIFRNEFLGTTGNSMNCVITNEKDIRFKSSPDNDTLKAFSINPILIVNKALGYRITYYLDKFEYAKPSQSFSYEGKIFFKEDSTAKISKTRYLENKRKAAYLGSRMHFLRSLWVDNLNSEGFTVRNSANEIIGYKKIVVQKGNHRKYLTCPGGLGIAYYTKISTSFIVFHKELVYFDADGYYEPEGIIWEGEMARQRIADLVPYDYYIRE
jgi:hypothetical protein